MAEKIRLGDKQVNMKLAEFDFQNKPVVIIDDMASTGRTLAKAATLLFKAGALQVSAVITHPLFCGNAEAHIRQSGKQEIWSTDSISHSSACIYLNKLLAKAIKEML